MEPAHCEPMNSHIPGKPAPIQRAHWPKVSHDMNALLMAGHVFTVDGDSIVPLQLPEEYWERNDVPLTPQLAQLLERDLEW